ncbi:MAG: hypothetical protein O9301_06030 [Leptospira sp.]|nr:hypothetical protein [Leptospira sp.]
MKNWLIVIFIFTSLLFVNCDFENSKYDDDYGRVALLQLLVAPNNPGQTCKDAISKKDECFTILANANGFPYTNTSESTKEATCDSLRTSAFKDMTDRAQTCVFQCQVRDWQTKVNSNECAISTPNDLLNSSNTNPVVTACIRSCLSATSNVVTEDKILSLLIFNTLQSGE